MTRAYQTPGQPTATTASCAGGLSRYARGQLVLALDQAERGVARQAQQSANALPARGLLVRAAGMVVVDEDGSAFLESGVAHRAGVLLDLQEPVELLPGQAVPDELRARSLLPALPLCASAALPFHWSRGHTGGDQWFMY
jgi:hypothetical protein